MSLVRVSASLLAGVLAVLWTVVPPELAPGWSRTGIWLAVLGLAAIAANDSICRPIGRPGRHAMLFVAVLAVALIPRTFRLGDLPFDVTFDEALHPLFGLDVLRKEPWRILDGASDYFATPYLDLAIQAWPALWLPGLLGGRAASVVLSVASLAGTFGLTRLLFGRRVALVAVAVLAVSHWHILYSRLAHPYMQPTALVPLALYFAVAGARGAGSGLLTFVAGILIGASILVYTPARIIVVVFSVWWLIAVLRNWYPWRRTPVLVAGAVLVALPYLRAQGVDGVIVRFREALAGRGAASGGLTASIESLVSRIADGLRVYAGPDAWMAPHDRVDTALLDPATGVLALLGLAACAWRWRSAGASLVLIWTLVTFVAAQVLTDLPQAAYRAAPLLPALAIAAALGLQALIRLVVNRFGVPSRWMGGAWLLGMGAWAAVAVPWNARALEAYMMVWSGGTVSRIGRLAADLPASTEIAVLAMERVATDPRFALLTDGRTAVDVPSLVDFLAETSRRRDHDVILIAHHEFIDVERVVRNCFPDAESVAPSGTGGGVQPVMLRLRAEAGRMKVSPCSTGSGAEGLRAVYFADAAATGAPVADRIEAWPYRWGNLVDGHEFASSVRTGYVRIENPGDYRFVFHGPATPTGFDLGAGRLQLLPGQAGTIRLEGGRYPVRMHCVAADLWSAPCSLFWQGPGVTEGVVPPSALSPD